MGKITCMKGKHLFIAVYIIFALSLFAAAGYLDKYEAPQGFASLGIALQRLLLFILISFVSSSALVLLAIIIDKKFTPALVVIALFFNIMMGIAVALALNFILWITQSGGLITLFQKIFLIATITTMVTVIWLAGDIFTKKPAGKKNRQI